MPAAGARAHSQEVPHEWSLFRHRFEFSKKGARLEPEFLIGGRQLTQFLEHEPAKFTTGRREVIGYTRRGHPKLTTQFLIGDLRVALEVVTAKHLHNDL